MKETGIIMSGNHPKLILDGTKTMTRRVITPQPTCACDNPNWQGQKIDWIGWKYEGREGWFCHTCGSGLRAYDEWSAHGIICPYGQVGDRLWVREAWATEKRLDKFSGSELGIAGNVALWYKSGEVPSVSLERGRWRSSRFMPRWASRILLEITELRAERLQEITEEDAKAEGAPGIASHKPYPRQYRDSFEALWDSLNAKRGYGWEVNPWVWAISFRRL